MKKNKQVIILLGPPGSGKGTQGMLLAERLGLYYLETAKVGEKAIDEAEKGAFIEVDGKKYFFAREKENWKKGILWSPPFVEYLMEKKIKELHEMGESLLLAGSPRTLYEAEKLTPLLEKLYEKENIKIILMEVSVKESIFRNSHRRICQLMRHPILYSEETKNLNQCPLDGSKLIRREGLDDPETIKVRLKEYKERTMPLVDYFKKRELTVKQVDGEGSVSEVFERNLKALK